MTTNGPAGSEAVKAAVEDYFKKRSQKGHAVNAEQAPLRSGA